MTKRKHVPQRTCVGCRTTSSKREFVRIVRAADGVVDVDPTGKQDGRGAYLCSRHECWEMALKKDQLGRALRTTLPPETREELLRYAERFEPAALAAKG